MRLDAPATITITITITIAFATTATAAVLVACLMGCQPERRSPVSDSSHSDGIHSGSSHSGSGRSGSGHSGSGGIERNADPVVAEPGLPVKTADSPLQRGADYLLAQQHDDGLWRSEYYGNLKLGAAMTAFVLYSLGHAKPYLETWPEDEVQTAFEALQPNIRKFGYVTSDSGPDYSNYGSAMYLLAAVLCDYDLPPDIERQLIEYLVRAQLDEAEGFQSDQVDYGGWDLSGWMAGRRPTTGTSISVTATVVEALAAFAPLPGPEGTESRKNLPLHGRRSYDEVIESLQLATRWLTKLQNFDAEVNQSSRVAQSFDGGFYFHPEREHDGNKAGWHTESRKRPRSYGSATADGLRSLLLLQTLADLQNDANSQPIQPLQLAQRIQLAAQWLDAHDQIDGVPGFENEPASANRKRGWAQGLIFYYLYARTKAARLRQSLPTADPSAENQSPPSRENWGDIRQELARRQRPDGSWQNPVARMREDDPLIATGLALIALSEVAAAAPAARE